jgi:hypothetical protein
MRSMQGNGRGDREYEVPLGMSRRHPEFLTADISDPLVAGDLLFRVEPEDDDEEEEDDDEEEEEEEEDEDEEEEDDQNEDNEEDEGYSE